MTTARSANWSTQRKGLANQVALMLYGVIAIMSAELAFVPGSASAYVVAAGALLVGVAAAISRMFVELVKCETEHGSHLPFKEAWVSLRSSVLILAFPSAVAALVLLGQLLGLPRGAVAKATPYISVATVAVLGFSSSYILDRKPGTALTRCLSWTLLSLMLFAAKHLLG